MLTWVQRYLAPRPFLAAFLNSLAGLLFFACLPVVLVAGRIFLKRLGLDLEAAGATFGFYLLVGVPWIGFGYWASSRFAKALSKDDQTGGKGASGAFARSSLGSALGTLTAVALIALVVIWWVW